MPINRRSQRNMKRSATKSWSNLPPDIVNLIAENLYYYADYADQVRFRTICKSWQSTCVPLKEINLQPWLFSCHSISHLFDTTRKLKYTIKTDPRVLHSKIKASKDGWVLFSKANINPSPFLFISYNSSPSSLFFYNPFTASIIELPPLHMFSSDKATFSTAPTSSFCTVFVLSVYYSTRRICISTCKPGERTWTRHFFDGFYGDLHGLTYLRGVLYCSFCNNVLGAFRVSTNSWKIYPHNRIRPTSVYLYYGLIESEHEGSLVSVYYDSHRLQWLVFRFDLLKENWVEVNSLDDRALFLNPSSTSMKLAVDDASELANTIHVECSSSFYKKPEDERLDCPQSFDWILEEKPETIVWIQPPLKRGDTGIQISNCRDELLNDCE